MFMSNNIFRLTSLDIVTNIGPNEGRSRTWQISGESIHRLLVYCPSAANTNYDNANQ